MNRILPIFCFLLLALPALAADEAKRDGSSALVVSDRLLIREAQLAMAQAHIARLQAEAQVRQTEDTLNQILRTLKTQYACLDCELQADFSWKRPPEAPKPTTDVQPDTPAPPGASGQTSIKE